MRKHENGSTIITMMAFSWTSSQLKCKKVAAFFPCYILCLCINHLRTPDYTSVKLMTWKSVDLGWGNIYNKKDQPSERNTKIVTIYFIPLHVTMLWECVWLPLGTEIMNQSVSKEHLQRTVSNVRIPRLLAWVGCTNPRSSRDKSSVFLKRHKNVVLQRSAWITLL